MKKSLRGGNNILINMNNIFVNVINVIGFFCLWYFFFFYCFVVVTLVMCGLFYRILRAVMWMVRRGDYVREGEEEKGEGW